MPHSRSVTIGPEFFAKTFNDYADWRWSLAREFLQNCQDAPGTRNIDVTLRLGFLPKLRILLEKMALDIAEDIAINVQPKPAVSPQIPNNPAVEGDEVKAFIDLEVS